MDARLERLLDTGRSVLREAKADAITGEAAKVTYYFFLSLFPLILALFALTGMLGGQEAFRWIMGHLRQAMPGEAAAYVEGFVREITGDERPGMLSFGLVVALWAASNAFDWLTRALNVMFDVTEKRPWWKRRALALVAVVATLLLVTVSAVVLVSGPDLLGALGLEAGWRFLRWPLVWGMITGVMWLIYYLLPNRPRPASKAAVLTGALAATALWVVATLAFRGYVASFGNYGATYGVVGGIIVLLLWLYLTALAILFGGEVAATLEQGMRGQQEDD